MSGSKVLRLALTLTGMIACAMESTSETSPLADDDVSGITWAHAVNSVRELEDALAGDVNFLEADVTMGNLDSHRSGSLIPVMAHPPKNESDITLERWLDTVIARRTGKGVKLDFKSIEAVQPSLDILRKHDKKIKFPLWLNADILAGPVSALTRPVLAADFVNLCSQFFPNATLSLGWTTYYSSLFPAESLRYEWEHVRKMADVVRCQGLVDRNVTFPVRAVFVRRSYHLLRWLLSEFEKSTLTVWSAKGDLVEVDDLLKIRESFAAFKVYYDVPEPLLTSFRAKKDNHKLNTSDIPEINYRWTSFDRSLNDISCASHTYVKNNTVVFGRGVTSAVLMSNVFHLSQENRFQVEGRVTFFDGSNIPSNPQQNGSHSVRLVIVDVSLFSKNQSGTPEEDNAIMWEAMNQSVLHEFKHDFHVSSTSCRLFKLDSASEEGFKAWEVPCGEDLDEQSLDKMLEDVGQKEKVRGRKLVLPLGDVMFGIISSGTGHVAAHQIEAKGTVSLKVFEPGINMASFKPTALLLIVVSLLFFFM